MKHLFPLLFKRIFQREFPPSDRLHGIIAGRHSVNSSDLELPSVLCNPPEKRSEPIGVLEDRLFPEIDM